MKVEDIKTYLQIEREKRWNRDGISMAEISEQLGCCMRSAQRWVKLEISAGRLRELGKRRFLDASGRQNQCATYQVVPHEV